MKKLFTILAATLLSVSMFAATGVYYSATPAASSLNVAASTVQELTASQATISGGKLFAVNNNTKAGDFLGATAKENCFLLGGTLLGFKVTLDQVIEAGDTVSVIAYTNGSGEDNGRGIFVTTATSRPNSADCTLKGVSETGKEFVVVKHVVASTDDICGKDTVYFWRVTGNNTYFKDFKITRPAPSTEPVTEVTISGKTACYTGKSITLEATTDVKADDYKWTVDGVDQAGTNAASFNFTPAAAGTYSIVCSAKNANNADWVASAAHSVVATEKEVLTELVPVDGDITWDFNNIASANVVAASAADTIIYWNLDAEWAASFASKKLAGCAQYHFNAGSYQCFQGTLLMFTTTVAGKVSVQYSNTGGNRPYRYVEVNGTRCAVGSASTDKITTEDIAVDAGDVVIKFYIPNASNPQSREGDVVGYSMGRVYKIVFTQTYSITVADNIENGTIVADKVRAAAGEKVVITATPTGTYKTALVTVNGTPLALDGEEISFNMPAEDVVIDGEFTQSGYPTAVDNTVDNAKAIKTIENGQLVIIKNGVRYNVLGAELR